MRFIKKIVSRNAQVRQLAAVVAVLGLEQDVERRFREMVKIARLPVHRAMVRALEATITTAALGQTIQAMRIDVKADLKALAGAIAISHASPDVREAEPPEGKGWLPAKASGPLRAQGHYLGPGTCIYVMVAEPEHKLLPPIDYVKVTRLRWLFEQQLAASLGAVRQGTPYNEGRGIVTNLRVSIDPRYERDFTSIFIVEGTGIGDHDPD